MRIFVQSTEQYIEDGICVSVLLSSLSQQYPQLAQARGVALAINEEVLPKQDWSHRVLCNGDRIEFFTASQGG